ncbi:MAG: DUF4340 domain-containing protein [Planctomycetaceae bacterium]|nr:DUF4340 domain-containing protein [Planctomycetaceae bacterium]
MNENTKTLTFVIVAVVVVAAAFLGRPSSSAPGTEDYRNQSLYPDFKNPLNVTSLEIVDFDDQRGEVIPFHVAQADVKGKSRWSIPSHDNYPADAKDQVASAAAGLMGLKVIDMVSENQGDQREYGVVDPDPQVLKVGATGVGSKVIMRDKDGKELLALIIGHEVPDRPELRYVRKVGQDQIFIVQAKTDKLSTKFEDWIERNLLGINSFDIQKLWIRDHSVDQLNSALIQRGETVVEYNDAADPRWKLAEDRKFKNDSQQPGQGRWVTVKPADDQQLNAAKLDELKTALDDLKIVDVARKPAGLSADLKAAADFTAHQDAADSLAHKGFFVAELTSGHPELFSNDGEIRIVMKDGAVYVLRFGEIAGAGVAKKNDQTNKKAKDINEKKKDGGLNRYLFVMAEFDPTVIPKPQLDPLPEAKKAATSEKASNKKPDVAKDDKKSDDAKKISQAQRETIEKENKRKQEEYDQKLAEGKKRVADLNARFADWYYVISDDIYHKIHLGHDQLFEKKEKPKSSDAKSLTKDGHGKK